MKHYIYITSSFLNSASEDMLDEYLTDKTTELYPKEYAISENTFEIVVIIDVLLEITSIAKLKNTTNLLFGFSDDISVKPLTSYFKKSSLEALFRNLKMAGLRKKDIDFSIPIPYPNLLHFDKGKKEFVNIAVADEDATSSMKIVDIYLTSSHLNHILEDDLDLYLRRKATLYLTTENNTHSKIFLQIVLLIDGLLKKQSINKLNLSINYFSISNHLFPLGENLPPIHFINDITVKPLLCYIQQDPYLKYLSKNLKIVGLSKECIDLSIPINCSTLVHFDKDKKQLISAFIPDANRGSLKSFIKATQKKTIIKNSPAPQSETPQIKNITILSSYLNKLDKDKAKNYLKSIIRNEYNNSNLFIGVIILIDKLLEKGSISTLQKAINDLNEEATRSNKKINDSNKSLIENLKTANDALNKELYLKNTLINNIINKVIDDLQKAVDLKDVSIKILKTAINALNKEFNSEDAFIGILKTAIENFEKLEDLHPIISGSFTITPQLSYIEKNPNLQKLFDNAKEVGLDACCIRPYLRIDYIQQQPKKRQALESWSESIEAERASKKQCTTWETSR